MRKRPPLSWTSLKDCGKKPSSSLSQDVRGRNSLGRDYLPLQLRRLPSEQVEDILCVYKNRIKEMRNQSLQRIADKSGSG